LKISNTQYIGDVFNNNGDIIIIRMTWDISPTICETLLCLKIRYTHRLAISMENKNGFPIGGHPPGSSFKGFSNPAPDLSESLPKMKYHPF
jgi:hypothetical protein